MSVIDNIGVILLLIDFKGFELVEGEGEDRGQLFGAPLEDMSFTDQWPSREREPVNLS